MRAFPKLLLFKRQQIFIYAPVACLCVALVVSIQLFSENQIYIFSNFLIPDGLIYHRSLSEVLSGRKDLSYFSGSWGVPIYYFAFGYLGIIGFLVANTILIVISAWFLPRRIPYFALFVYPYFLLSLILPSKDILVLFMFTACFSSLIAKRFFVGLLLCFIVYFIRDGAFFILLPVIILAWYISKGGNSILAVVLTFVIGTALSLGLELIAGNWFVFTRNQHIFEKYAADKFGDISGMQAYFVRVFLNLTNWAFRPMFMDKEGGMAVTAISFFISGVSSLAAAFYSIRMLVQKTFSSATISSVFYFVSLAVISLNPMVHPRYQLPASVIVTAVAYDRYGKRDMIQSYLFVIAISALAYLVYALANVPFPPETSVLRVDLLDLSTIPKVIQ